MAFSSFSMQITLLISFLAVFTNCLSAKAGDPDITSDFLIPPDVTTSDIDGSFFTYSGLHRVIGSSVSKFTLTRVSKTEFPALDGQSVSMSVLQFPAGSVNPPHTHPRAAELLFVIRGSLEVGFVDTTNKLYTQTLLANELFVFPKGMVHYQYNSNPYSAATAISAFGSSNAGTASLPASLFSSNIEDPILARSFRTDVVTIQRIKAGLANQA
ncbi:OLC1v1004648C1 [Oldenlandia corymbosa var. corymbosa]|uniref:Germin-like protein n=1 Tax=Oldenlandia corymbosa var. corymbosa TaxID=529605 RepID=A0AAV1DCU4_OLDCO|nr:OLC1v1004648C1 [Oldenlandia corymbosa var. corymbosa]